MKYFAFLLTGIFALMESSLAERPSSGATELVEDKDGWRANSPRDEIRPAFERTATGGRGGRQALVIRADSREGLDGHWAKSYPIRGGAYYRFEAFRKTENVGVPRRSAMVRILWQDAQKKKYYKTTAR